MPVTPTDIYRREVERALQAGNATEHTHRPALKALIESLATGVTATNEPKHVECGAPDFIVSRKAAHGPVTLGYIEAKSSHCVELFMLEFECRMKSSKLSSLSRN